VGFTSARVRVAADRSSSIGYAAADPLARPIHTIDETGRLFPMVVDGAGRIVSLKNPFNEETSFGYDGGDLVSIQTPDLQTTRRHVDGVGRVRGVTDPLGNRTQYDYDVLDRLTRVTDPRLGIVEFAYDKNGNLDVLTDRRHTPPAVTDYEYDARDRLLRRTDPLSHQETFGYDEGENVTTHVDRRLTITDTRYDARGRRMCVGYGRIGGVSTDCMNTPNYESTIQYTYDIADRLTDAVDSTPGAGSVSRTYDDMDQVLTETTPQGAITYTYEAGSERRATMTVAGQPTLGYCYDEAGRLERIVDGTSCTSSTPHVDISHDSAGRRLETILPTGAAMGYGYDAASRVSSILFTKPDQTMLGGLTYGYDAAGNRVLLGGEYGRTVLPAATPADATYDVADRILTWAGTPHAYDDNGNLTDDGPNTYVWNKRNQLVAITGGVTASFGYDALGRRQARTVAGTATTFQWDGFNRAKTITGGTTSRMITGLALDEHFGRIESGTTMPFLTDALGSTIVLLNGATVAAEYAYEPYGAKTKVGGTSATDLLFTGREDDGTGQYYYRARYYAPTWGRFLSQDPLGFGGGLDLNLYAYVLNNPVTLTDPLGLEPAGPYHPPPGVSTGCTPADSCEQILKKMWLLQQMIKSHEGWDRNVPPPRGGPRHAEEIAQLWRAYARCQDLALVKCKCPPHH
jgi:RHS repeat-associated protein